MHGDWRNSHWYRQAEGRPVGYRFRTWHEDCTQQNHMQVSVSREGVSCYCHKCKEKMFVPAPALSLAEKAAQKAAQHATDTSLQKSKAYPLPETEDPSDWPLDDRAWLYKAGLMNEEIIGLGIYYHKPSGRVVVPISDSGRATGFWQGRSVSGQPKYLNPAGFDRSVIVQSFLPDERAGYAVTILVEDFLSAYRVNRATGYRTIALLGTTLSSPVAARIVREGETCLCWFDNDSAGKAATNTIRKQLSSYGIEATAVRSEKDPKRYSDNEIRGILNELGY